MDQIESIFTSLIDVMKTTKGNRNPTIILPKEAIEQKPTQKKTRRSSKK